MKEGGIRYIHSGLLFHSFASFRAHITSSKDAYLLLYFFVFCLPTDKVSSMIAKGLPRWH